MGRAPCCDKANVKKGPWSPDEDAKLKEYIDKYGTHGNWIALPHKAGLKRCGKSCRLRWLNYLRPDIKHGEFSEEEDRIIYSLYASIGSRWSTIAAQLPGRTDNDVKNYWNTKLKKKLAGSIGIHQPSHRKPEPPAPTLRSTSSLSSADNSLSSLMHVNSSTFSSNFNHYYHLNPSMPALTALDLFLPPLSIATTGTSTPSPSPTTGKPSLFQTSHGCVNSMNFLRFGGEVSCSCSDRSSRQIKQEEEEEEEMGGFQDFLCTRVQGSDYQKADVDSVCGSSHECKM